MPKASNWSQFYLTLRDGDVYGADCWGNKFTAVIANIELRCRRRKRMKVWDAFRYLYKIVVTNATVPDEKAQEALAVICNRLREMDIVMEDMKKRRRKNESKS